MAHRGPRCAGAPNYDSERAYFDALVALKDQDDPLTVVDLAMPGVDGVSAWSAAARQATGPGRARRRRVAGLGAARRSPRLPGQGRGQDRPTRRSATMCRRS